MNHLMVRRTNSRRNHSEHYDELKLRRSLSTACNSVGISEGATEDIVKRVMQTIQKWLDSKSEVTDCDIRRKASERLEELCPEAGYLYKNQKSIL